MNDSCPRCGRSISLPSSAATFTSCPDCVQKADRTMTDQSRDRASSPDIGAIQQEFSVPDFAQRYRMKRLVGQGATGVVFECEDLDYHRLAAIKILTCCDRAEIKTRFLREGQILAEIRHPNVVSVYEVGELAGHPYIILEFVDGGTLRDILQTKASLNLPEAIGIALACLSGLQACHSRGIIHRDLKPENILFFNSGHVKISDFGVAKLSSTSDSFTKTGALLGTPRYMSPEQIRGESTGPATDLYAMGITLFEMLTGAPPFDAPGVYDLLRKHMETPPPRLDEVLPGLPPAMATIIDRCLDKNPLNRPPSVEAVSAELQAILNVRAAKISKDSISRPRTLEGSGKNDLVAGPGSGLWTVSSLTSVDVRGLFTSERMPAILRELSQSRTSWILAGLTLVFVCIGLVAFPIKTQLTTTTTTTTTATTAPVLTDPQIESSPIEDYVRPRRTHRKTGQVRGLAVSRDGSIVAVATKKGAVCLRGATTGELLLDLQGQVSTIESMTFSPNGSLLASGSEDGLIVLWGLPSGQKVQTIRSNTKVYTVAFSPDGKLLAWGGRGNIVRLWDLKNGREKGAFSVGPESIRCLSFSPDGQTLATGGTSRSLKLWNVSSLTLRAPEIPALKTIRVLAFSPDGKTLFFGGGEQPVTTLDVESGNPIRHFGEPTHEIETMDLSPDGGILATGGQDLKVRLWQTSSGRCLFELSGHQEKVRAVAFLNGTTVISGADDGVVRRWNVGTGQEETHLCSMSESHPSTSTRETPSDRPAQDRHSELGAK